MARGPAAVKPSFPPRAASNLRLPSVRLILPAPMRHALRSTLRSLRKPRGFAAALIATLALGTALGVYTLWVLVQDGAATYFDGRPVEKVEKQAYEL